LDRNALLAVVLSMVVFTSWAMYQSHRSSQRAQSSTQVEEAARPKGTPIEKSEEGGGADESIAQPSEVPTPIAKGVKPVEPPAPAAAAAPDSRGVEPWSRRYDFGDYTVELTNQGGAVVDLVLHDFFERLGRGSEERPVQLVTPSDDGVGALATPFSNLGVGDLSNARFAVVDERDDGVSFVWQRQGVRVEKRFEFDPDDFGFHLTLRVVNGTDRVLSPSFDVLWPVTASASGEFSDPNFTVLRDGSVKRSPIAARGFFGRSGQKEPVEYSGEIDWAALENKYFVRALLPDRPRSTRAGYKPVEVAHSGVMSVGFDPVEIPPGQSIEHEFRGYVGPKRVADLDAVSPTLERTINRGYHFLEPLTAFFEWMLRACYRVVPNYGIAIIVLTILVRLATMPIMGRQMKSMERMRAVQPMMKEIQEKYADDRQKQSEELMALYRREGVNPLGGCLPMLLQFPVFIGLFYALQSSFELRHAGFMLWINDLSAPESLFTLPGLDIPVRVLPLIMGVSMVLQQRLTPTTVDPAQARMMMTVMPIMFTVLFYQFPSGLVLYWMVSNLLGIGHQLWVRRNLAAATAS